MADPFVVQALKFCSLVPRCYENVMGDMEKEEIVDKLVEDISARFTKEPQFAVVIAVWNAMNNCINAQVISEWKSRKVKVQ